MHFSAFIVFQIVLVVGFNSVEAGCKHMEEMRKVMCGDEDKDKKDEIMSCIEKVNFDKYADMVKPCAEGLESMEPRKMVDYWCSKEDEEAMGMIKCMDKEVKDSGKEEEMKAEGEPIKKCMEEKFGKKEEKEE